MAVQEGPTSIRVSWSPPTPLGDTTGYRIYYSGGSSGSVNATSTEVLLSQLLMGGSYNISLVATSQHLPSAPLVESLKVMLVSSDNAATAGGTVTAVFIIAITVAVVIIAALVVIIVVLLLKNRRRNVSIKKAE